MVTFARTATKNMFIITNACMHASAKWMLPLLALLVILLLFSLSNKRVEENDFERTIDRSIDMHSTSTK